MDNLQVGEIEAELHTLRAKVAEVKDLVDNLLCLWDDSNGHLLVNEAIEELREVFDDLDI